MKNDLKNDLSTVVDLNTALKPLTKWTWGIEQRNVLWPGMESFRAGQIVTVNGEQMRVSRVGLRTPTEGDLAIWPDMPEGSLIQYVSFGPSPDPANLRKDENTD